MPNKDSASQPQTGSRQLIQPQGTLVFEPNAGQDQSDANYIVRSESYLARLNRRSVSLVFSQAAKVDARNRRGTEKSDLTLEFRGALANVEPAGEQPLQGCIDYFPTGNPADWMTNIPTFRRVHYRSLYAGIDLSFYERDGRMEYDVDVAAGANPKALQIALNGQNEAKLNAQGDLVLKEENREVRFLKPNAYQLAANGTQEKVEAAYSLRASFPSGKLVDTVSFVVGQYDHARALVIDPVLVYGELVPYPASAEQISAIAPDASGNVYLTGSSSSNNGAAYIQKLDANGNVLFTAQLGTQIGVNPNAIAVDSAGNISVSGYANPGTVPTTSSAYQQSAGFAGANAFVAVLKSDGSALNYASYFGGTQSASYANSVAVDAQGKVYLTGYSSSSDFPTTSGAFATAANDGYNFGWVAKLDPTQAGAASLLYATALPANQASVVESAIAVDSSGNAYVTGNVAGPGFPATTGAYTYNGQQAGMGGVFVTKLNAGGSALVYSAGLGPGSANSVAVDGSGAAYVTGTVGYDDYPITPGAWQTAYPAGFATKLSADGTTLIYSTFLSGPSGYTGSGITPETISIPPGCAQNCVATIAGLTTATDLPLVNPIQSFNASAGAGFIIQLASAGTSAAFSSYLSGVHGAFNSAPGAANPMAAVDGSGNIYFAGNTASTDVPLTAPIAQNAGYGYLAKIGPANGSSLLFTPNSVAFGAQTVGFSTAKSTATALPVATLRNAGSQSVHLQLPFTVSDSDFSETDNCPATLPSGGACTLTFSFTPSTIGARSGTITATGNSSSVSAQLQLSGTGQDAGLLVASPSSVTFANQATGTVSAAQTVTLSNTGNGPLTLGSLSMKQFNNADATAFPEVDNCPVILDPEQSCQVSMQFAPSQLGSQSAYLSSSNQADVAYVSGVGIASGAGGSGSISLSASLLNFGAVSVGTVAPAQYSYLQNIGTVPVNVLGTSVTLTSAQGNAGDFSVSLYDSNIGTACATLLPGTANPAETSPDICGVSVTFTPSVAGTETATVSVTDTTSGSPHTFTVSGMGVAATQTLESIPGNAVFAEQPVGTSSASQAFYFYNTGTSPIAISRVLASGDFQINYTFNQCAGTTLNPYSASSSNYCYVLVTFTPTATGVRTGNLELMDSATGNPQVFSLVGTGISAVGSILATPENLVFPTQATGTTSATQSIVFANTGNVPIQVNSLAFTGDFAFSDSGVFCSSVEDYVMPPISLGVGQYCEGSVTFTPTQTSGTETGTLIVGTTAGNSIISLSGPAQAATQAVGLWPATVGFGNVQQGTTAGTSEYAILVRNAGTEALTFSSTSAPVITGNNSTPSADFSDTGEYGGSTDCWFLWTYSVPLPPGQTCPIYVSFTPSTTAAESATLTLTDSAGTQTVTLAGTGVAAQPAASTDPVTQAFDQETIGTATPNQSYVYFYNNTSSGLTVVTDSIATGSSDFLITPGQDTCAGNIVPANSSCSVEVTFQPLAAGLRAGTLSIKDQNSNIYTVALSGYANAVVDQALLAPLELDFAPQSITAAYGNGLQGGQSLTLTNYGNQPLTVGTLTGSDLATAAVSTGDFTINSAQGGVYGSDACSGQALAPGNSCTVYVGFVPATTGAKNGNIVFPVTYQGGTTANLTTTFVGTGIAEEDSVFVTPTQASFLDQPAGYSGSGLQVETISLTNTGTQALSVGQLTGTDTIIGSASSGDFVATSVTVYGNLVSGLDGCSNTASIAPGGTCFVYVYFVPGSIGAITGSITFPVTFTDGSTTSITANLSGNGVASSNGPMLTPGAVAFAAEVVGVTDENQQAVTLANNGNNAFAVGTVNGSNFGAGSDFDTGSSDECSGAVLNPGQACVTYVAFTPLATGTRSGTLIFPITYANSPNPVNLTATLSGTGIASSQAILPSVTKLTFPGTAVSTTSSALNLIFSNRGSTAYTMNSAVVTGTNASEFAIASDACSGTTLVGNSSCIVQLTFTPAAAGARTATVTESDTAPGSPRLISLNGAGTRSPQIQFLPSTLAFGQGLLGVGSPAQTVGVTNTGVASASITAITSTVPAEFAVVNDNCSGHSLIPGGTCTFGAIFSPAQTGARSASINVLNSSGTATLSATGTGATELSSTTTLAASPAGAVFGSLFTLTAAVKDASNNPITAGSVGFYNGAALLGTSQIIGTASGGGVVGTAIYRTRFLPLGANIVTAKFIGPNASSTSATTTVTVTGTYPSTTGLTATGTQGNYVLTGTVSGGGTATPTGSLSFNDLQTGTTLGTIALNPATLTQTFVQGSPLSIGAGSQTVVGDLNGDGIPDLVEVASGSNGISVLLGNGDGTFQGPRIVPVHANVSYIALGDFNGDGRLDVVATTGGSTIAVILGNGNGTFGEPSFFEAGSDTHSISVGDFDGDGKLDLAVTNLTTASVSILLGNGDGSFQPPAVFATGNYPAWVSTADINGDGKLDIVAANGSDATVSVLLGNGNGTFQNQKVYSTGNQNYQWDTIVVGDVNGDGKPDIVVNNYSDDTLTVLINGGSGTFTAEPPFSVIGNPTSVAMSDLNGNGILDLAIANSSGGVSVSLGNGNGSFQTPLPYGSGTGDAFAAIADLNGDGRPDIVFTNNSSNGTSTVLINTVAETATLAGVGVAGTGLQNVVASYGGDTNFAGGTSNSVQLTSGILTAAVTLTAQPSASVSYGTSLSVQVSVAGQQGFTQPTGTVSYTVDGGTAQNASLVSSDATLALGSALAAGAHSVVVNYSGDTLHSAASKTVSLTVTKSNQTITFNSLPDVIYGISPFALSVSANSGLPVTYKVVSGPATISGNGVTVTGVGTVTIEADQAGNANYNQASPQQQSFTVSTAMLTINVNSSSRSYGGSNPTFTGSIAGTVNGDTITATYSTAATSTSPVGTYAITASPSGTALPNYSVTINQGTLTITKTALTVTVNNASRAYGASNPAFTGTITGLLNGDNVIAVYSTPATAASHPGNYPITGTLSGSALGNYQATIVQANLTINKATPVVTWTSPSAITYGTALSTTQLDATSGGVAGTFAYTPAVLAIPGAGLQTLSVTFTPTDTTDYNTAIQTTTLTVNKAVTTTTIATSVNPSVAGQSVTFTATVTSPMTDASGTVTFKDGSTVLGSGTLNSSGVASFATSSLAGGGQSITAAYGGDGNDLSSSSAALTQTVEPPATMLSPAPGSVLAGSSVTFAWTSETGSAGYWLFLGTTGVGSKNLYDSGEQKATSATFNGLPANGVTIYARVYTSYNGILVYNDYIYTAWMQPPAMSSPAPGSILAGPSATFTWTAAASGNQGYWLFLGTTGAGSKNLYDSGQQTATSATFSSLPTNGETIYARVYTRYNGTLVYNDYTFSAAAQAMLTTPTPGVSFTGTSVTFNWTAATGSGNQGYWLFLGTTGVGSKNLYDSGQQSTTSATFSNLPANGETIYARVYTRYNGILVYNDYTYTAWMQPPVLTSPAPGSTLAGASATFTWTAAAAGNQGYWLFLGTTGVGSKNLYDSGQQTATSATFNSLPTNGSTIYARVYTRYNGTLVYNDYTYIAK